MIIKAVGKFKIVILLTILVFIFSTTFIFADSSDEKLLSNDFIMESALRENTKAGTTYTTTDIYNLLYTALINGSTSAYGAITEINNNLTYYVSGTNWSIAELVGMTWGIANNIEDALNYNNTLTNTTNGKLENIFNSIDTQDYIKWENTGTYLGYKTNLSDSSWSSSSTTTNHLYCGFNLNKTYNGIYRFTIPIKSNVNVLTGGLSINSFILKYGNSTFNGDVNNILSIEPHYYGYDIYVYNFVPWTTSTTGYYIFECTFNNSPIVYSSDRGYVYSIQSSNIDSFTIRNALSKSKDTSNIQKLVDVYASDDYLAAKAAQQDYENDVISNFTGNGSGAASRSDQNNLKNTSGALKNGLSSGGSVSNGLGVFNNSSDIWMWFSYDVKNSLDTTQNNRSLKSSNGDEIIDFYHQYKNNALSQLGD